MRVKTFQGDSLDAVYQSISDLIAADFKPTLAIVFSSVSHDLGKLRQLLSSFNLDVYGATSAGEIVDDEVLEFSVGGMLLDLDKEDYKIILKHTSDSNTFTISKETAIESRNYFTNPAFITLAGGIATDGEEIIRGFKAEMGEEVALFGGLAGDDLTTSGTTVFSNAEQSDNGLITLVINQDHIEVGNIAASGWESVGIEKTITKANGNIVYTIDGERALDVFIKYFGLSTEIDATKEVIEAIGTQFPLQIQRPGKPSVLRTPLVGNEEDHSIIFAGTVPEGAKVKFSVSPGFEIIDLAVTKASTLKPRIPEADALILVSCKARHLALGPLVEEEIAGMRELWDAPLVGFFSYGEIGIQESGTCDFHNETCSLIVLKSKK